MKGFKFNNKRFATAGAVAVIAVAAAMVTLPSVTAAAKGNGNGIATHAPQRSSSTTSASPRPMDTSCSRMHAGIACIAEPGVGTMGIHYVKSPARREPE